MKEDETTFVPLFTKEPEKRPLPFYEGATSRKYGSGIFVLVCGGDAGTWMVILQTYGPATNPVTRPTTPKQA